MSWLRWQLPLHNWNQPYIHWQTQRNINILLSILNPLKSISSQAHTWISATGHFITNDSPNTRLVYSAVLDVGFCRPCFLFATNQSVKGVLVNSAFTRWTKVTTIVGSHAKMEYNLESINKADAFKCGYKYPEKTICGHFNKELVERIARNHLIMECIVWAILYLGKQELSLCGRGQDTRRGSNPGNYLSLLHLMAENDETLRNHLHTPERQNATYISPQSQNEIIVIIQHQLLCEIKEAKFHAVLADKVSCHNVE